ncbi:I78 family peptidase inhibitor [Sphingomonas sp. PB4P5]|uniref:I78 family peptidase inhibitor n=1 Tax=Parasphingomonas puruogangriensis TaxID=3096155 RepID=UPI002FCC9DA8
MKLALAAPALVLALAACTQEHPAPLPAPAGLCKAAPVQRFVGQQATPALVEKVQRRSGASTARRITPEMRVTMEFNEARVNVWVGLKGEAERITCG